MLRFLATRPRTDRGASAVEYALLIVGIVTVILLVAGPLGDAFINAINPACRYVSGGANCVLGG